MVVHAGIVICLEDEKFTSSVNDLPKLKSCLTSAETVTPASPIPGTPALMVADDPSVNPVFDDHSSVLLLVSETVNVSY